MALGVGSAKQMGLLSYRILVRGVRVELRSLQVTLSKNDSRSSLGTKPPASALTSSNIHIQTHTQD